MENNAKEKDIRINERGWVDLSNLLHKNGKVLWKESYGLKVPFSYKGADGVIIIKDFIKSNSIYIEYEGKTREIHTNNIINIRLQPLFKENYRGWRYEIGDIVEHENGSFTILDRYRTKGNSAKKYTRICNVCKSKKDVLEYSFTEKYGCPICSRKRLKVGVNDFNSIHPDYAKFLVNMQDGEVPSSSPKKVNWKCNICNLIYQDSFVMVHKRGVKCPICHKSISTGERIIESILLQLGINFQPQKKFDWSDNRRYDFYLTNLNWIIEVHGIQHYKESAFVNLYSKARTLQEEQENDKFKQDMAKKHGIKKYIVINAEKSDIEWIKDSVLKSELFEVFDSNKIDWTDSLILGFDPDYQKKYDNLAVFNKTTRKYAHGGYKEIVDLWNEGKTTKEICSILNFDMSKVKNHLRTAHSVGHVDFSIRELDKRGVFNNHGVIPVRCTTTNHSFRSVSEFKNRSEEIYGTEYKNHTIDQFVNGGLLFLDKYKLEYITKEEFNKAKQEFPDLCYGDFFDLDKVG